MASNQLSDSFLKGSDEAADSMRSRRSVLGKGSDTVPDYTQVDGSEEVIDWPCAICQKRDGTQMESTNFCVECNSGMCASCTNFHASFPTLNTHKVVPISQADKHKQHTPAPSAKIPNSVVNTPDGKEPPSLAKLEKEINIRLPDDENCCDITSFCFLHDGSMIVTDYENWKVKQLDATYKINGWLKVPGKPYGVCYTQKDQVAITLFLEKMVYIVKTGKKMKKSVSFEVGDTCRGIAYSNGELFVCCGSFFDSAGGNVRVFNLKGKPLRRLQHDISGLSQTHLMFTVLQDITISPCGSKIIVTDEKKGLMTLEKSGYLLSAYTFPDIKLPYGLCCLKNGDFLICGWDSNNVLHVDKHGCEVTVVLKEQDGVVQPRAVCYDHVHGKLIVAINSSKTVKVFDMPSLSTLSHSALVTT